MAIIVIAVMWPLALIQVLDFLPEDYGWIKILLPVGILFIWLYLGFQRTLYFLTRALLPLFKKFNLSINFTDAAIKKFEKTAK
jgi:hypothetical protein